MSENNTNKKELFQRLLREIPELEKAGWQKYHLELLKKHFTFYVGLVNSDILPQNEKHKQFITTVKDWKNSKAKNVHEEIYINYIKFFMKKNLDIKNNEKIEDPVWKNVPENVAGAHQYSSKLVDKLPSDPTPKNYTIEREDFDTWAYEDWFDDWKYRKD